MMDATNIIPGPRSRKPPKAGDAFFAEIPGIGFLLGRVITTDAVWSIGGISSGTANLIYLYKGTYSDLDAALSAAPSELLTVPILTNNLPWSRGYFRPLLEDSKVEFPPPADRHCFRFAPTNSYYDEKGNLLSAPFGLVGDFGLHSYRSIDDVISDALGIDRAAP